MLQTVLVLAADTQRRNDSPYVRPNTSDSSPTMNDILFGDWGMNPPTSDDTQLPPVFEFPELELCQVIDLLLPPPNDLEPEVRPPSITDMTTEEECFTARKFAEAGIGHGDNELVWRGITEMIQKIAKMCSKEQKRMLWDHFQYSLNVPAVIWGKGVVIYHINPAYSELTDFYLEGEIRKSLFDINSIQTMYTVKNILPQIFTNSGINRFQMYDLPFPRKDGSIITMTVTMTVKRDVFGLPEYFIGYCMPTASAGRGVVIQGDDANICPVSSVGRAIAF
ncbi:hypothetical protein PROFUN_03968 [Planoprotostelium fungivorum]|uniref:PAS fold domain-containing protein n=1 Tax=Planoprotostelium fungivorum TaxID=1890364 RepID=A0A2P6MTV0_9EUKA|nr:hypothetical protein PROFUN_03968 [Planoprotostelium fungivorum]